MCQSLALMRNDLMHGLIKLKFLFNIGPDEPTGAQIPSMFLNYLGSDIDYKFHTEPEKGACLSSPDHKCYWPRGKVF